MAITRANIEAIMINRMGATLTACGLDGATVDGTNPAMVDPIGSGLRALGLQPASYVAITDSDLTGVDNSDIDTLLSLIELRLTENAIGNLTRVDITFGPHAEKFDQLRQGLERAAAKIRKALAAKGVDVAGQAGTLTAGTINMGYQALYSNDGALDNA